MYVNVQLVHLGKVREVVVENEDGGHTVFINEQLSEEARRAAFHHAMSHIEHDDFFAHGNADEIEGDRHVC